MNESTSTATHLPTIPTPSPVDPTGGTEDPRTGWFTRAMEQTHQLPQRDTDRAVLGGVCAGIAASTGVAPMLVRLGAVLLALGAGSGLGIYVLAWALMPDATGRNHVERAVRGGRGRSIIVSLLAGMAAVSMVFGVLATIDHLLPEVVELAIVAGLGWWGWTHLRDRRVGHQA